MLKRMLAAVAVMSVLAATVYIALNRVDEDPTTRTPDASASKSGGVTPKVELPKSASGTDARERLKGLIESLKSAGSPKSAEGSPKEGTWTPAELPGGVAATVPPPASSPSAPKPWALTPLKDLVWSPSEPAGGPPVAPATTKTPAAAGTVTGKDPEVDCVGKFNYRLDKVWNIEQDCKMTFTVTQGQVVAFDRKGTEVPLSVGGHHGMLPRGFVLVRLVPQTRNAAVKGTMYR